MAGPSKQTRVSVFTRDKHACVFCGQKSDLTLDHIQDRKWRGKANAENLQTVCRPCHTFKNGFQGVFTFWFVLTITLSLTRAKIEAYGNSCPRCRAERLDYKQQHCKKCQKILGRQQPKCSCGNTRSVKKEACRACLVNRTPGPCAANHS